MSTFYGFLHIVLFVLFIVGLFKPSAILKWVKKPTRLKVLGVYFLASIVLLALSSLAVYEENEAINYISSDTPADQTTQLGVEKEEDVEMAKETESTDEIVQSKINQLKLELKSINKGIDFSHYRGSGQALQLEIVMFATWANMIKEAETLDNKELLSLASSLKQELSKMQTKEFPKLRKEYAKIMKQILKGEKIDVELSGDNNEYICFISKIFENDAIRDEFHNNLKVLIGYLRFSEERYKKSKWDFHTYFEMFDGEDSDLVIVE